MTDTTARTDTPLVSVIIPVYNGALFLQAALESVFAQNYPHHEVIVIDDGSTDGSADIARAFSTLRLLQQTNQGPSVARNLGVAAASGELIAFLDADDVWMPHKIAAQVCHLLEYPHDGYVLCRMRAFCVPEVTMPAVFNARHWASEPMVAIPSALMVRAVVMTAVGPFDPQLRVAEDFDWFARAHDCGISAGMLDDVLFAKRIHHTNLSLDVSLNHSNMFRALQKTIARKRQTSSPQKRPT